MWDLVILRNLVIAVQHYAPDISCIYYIISYRYSLTFPKYALPDDKLRLDGKTACIIEE